MARTQKKSVVKASKKQSVFYEPTKGFNMQNMFAALNNVGIKVTKAQKEKIKREVVRTSTRSRQPVARFIPAVTVRQTKSQTKRNTTKKVNMNVNMTPKVKVIRVKQIPYIMKSYQGKPEKEGIYTHFKGLYDMYESKKDIYGFTPETDVKDMIRTLEQQQEIVPEEVDELAKLFGSTSI